ncbi:MAG: hypothetical protein FJ285_01030 [Planctomycetes bacterium]|nr:hypothetical protein [Planctomycetota bacterium]
MSLRSISICSRLAAVAAVGLLFCESHAAADEGEVHPDAFVWQSGGQLRTASWDHDTGEIIDSAARVFSAEFGEDPEFPFSSDEPGFGSNLVGTTLSINVLSGLSRWTGSEFASFAGAAISGEYGGSSGSSASGGSFSFLVTEGLDLHPNFTISGDAGNDPIAGIYLLAMQASASGFNSSDTFWVVFNLGSDEADHDAAIDWVQGNLVPAPGAVALLVLAGATRGRRRR